MVCGAAKLVVDLEAPLLDSGSRAAPTESALRDDKEGDDETCNHVPTTSRSATCGSLLMGFFIGMIILVFWTESLCWISERLQNSNHILGFGIVAIAKIGLSVGILVAIYIYYKRFFEQQPQEQENDSKDVTCEMACLETETLESSRITKYKSSLFILGLLLGVCVTSITLDMIGVLQSTNTEMGNYTEPVCGGVDILHSAFQNLLFTNR